METQRHKGKGHVRLDGGWRDAAKGKECPQNARSLQEEAKKNVCQEFSKAVVSADNLILIVYHYDLRRRQWHPTPVLLPGRSHGWRSLVGYSPWSR